MKKLLLFTTFSIFTLMCFSQKHFGINTAVNHQGNLSSGLQFAVPVYTYNNGFYSTTLKLFAGTGLNHGIGSGKTIDVPLQITGKLMSHEQLPVIRKKKLFPYMTFGTVVRFQQPTTLSYTISSHGEPVVMTVVSPKVNGYLKFSGGIEKQYRKLSVGAGLHLLSGMMLSDFRTSSNSVQAGSVWRNMLLGADLYLAFQNHKKFKPAPVCKCYFD